MRRQLVWYMYKRYDVQERDRLKKDTFALSELAAKYSVDIDNKGRAHIRVRCYENSKVYLLCKFLKYDYKSTTDLSLLGACDIYARNS